VRVPLPVVLLLCGLIIGGLWWKWTQGMDFLTPPSEESLAVVRQQAAQAAPPVATHPEPVEEKKTGPTEPAAPLVEPPLDPGDLITAPGLNAYAPEAKKGADHLIRLAKRLEELGATSRALLAWERVLDFGKGDTIQAGEALKAIRRLRATEPMWNVDPEGSLPLTLHFGASPATAEKLKPLLPNIARTVERASGGVVAVSTDLVVGKKPAAGTEAPPVALWLSGGPKEAPATEAVPFTVVSNDLLEREVYGTVFQLVRTKLSRSHAYAAPSAAGSTEDPVGALTCNITRFCWQDFAKAMNVIPPAAAAIPPSTTTGTKPKPAAGKPSAKPAKPAAKPTAKPAKPVAPKPAAAKPKPKPKPVRDADQE
jgi:hypothetical protein